VLDWKRRCHGLIYNLQNAHLVPAAKKFFGL